MDTVLNILDRDHDGDIDLEDVYGLIIELMFQESKDKKASGMEKKKASGMEKKYSVLKNIRIVMGTEIFDRYEPMIEKSIDFIFSIAQNSKALKFLKKSCKCSCFKK
jgi:hypothetical protein